MDERVFGPYYGTPPENRRPTIVIAPPDIRPRPRLTKRSLILAARQLARRTKRP